MSNLFVSMANNCKIIFEIKLNQIVSNFSLPMLLLPSKENKNRRKI